MMNHPERSFSFGKIESKEDLIEAMFNHSWPLCYGFYHNSLLYMSDGGSEDAPEYAIVTIDSTEGRFGVIGREVGRIAPRTMQVSEAQSLIEEINGGKLVEGTPVQIVAEPKWHHHCQYCGLEGE